MPFSDPWGPYTSVQPVRRSIVNHTTFAISAYCQVPLLHLGGVRQWFTGGSAQLLHVMTGIRTRNLAHDTDYVGLTDNFHRGRSVSGQEQAGFIEWRMCY